jgi:hypothetical protein
MGNNSAFINTAGKQKKYYTLLNSYLKFIEDHPEYNKKSKAPLKQKVYQDICKDFNQMLVEELLRGNEYKMPGRLGNLKIVKSKMKYNVKNMKIDFGHLRKTGEKIYHLNKHSDGYKARWYWGKKNCMVKHKTYYCFKPSRANKKLLAEIMKTTGGHKTFQTN